jgi:excisionase family DNA binding protein
MTEYIRNCSGCAAKIKASGDEILISGKYVDVWQAAEYLHVSVACIRKWQGSGKLIRFKAGRRVLVRLSDLEALVVADTPAEGDGA